MMDTITSTLLEQASAMNTHGVCILANGNNELQAMDIFKDALMLVSKANQQGDDRVNASFGTVPIHLVALCLSNPSQIGDCQDGPFVMKKAFAISSPLIPNTVAARAGVSAVIIFNLAVIYHHWAKRSGLSSSAMLIKASKMYQMGLDLLLQHQGDDDAAVVTTDLAAVALACWNNQACLQACEFASHAKACDLFQLLGEAMERVIIPAHLVSNNDIVNMHYNVLMGAYMSHAGAA